MFHSETPDKRDSRWPVIVSFLDNNFKYVFFRSGGDKLPLPCLHNICICCKFAVYGDDQVNLATFVDHPDLIGQKPCAFKFVYFNDLSRRKQRFIAVEYAFSVDPGLQNIHGFRIINNYKIGRISGSESSGADPVVFIGIYGCSPDDVK